MKEEVDKIEAFWCWFVQHNSFIQNSIQSESVKDRATVVEKMNNYILDLGLFTWDLGLNEENTWFLTISPNGDRELLEISQRIMEDAPTHLDWEFHASKPAKNWNRIFFVYNEQMDEIEIDANYWNFVATPAGDGKIILFLEAKNIQILDAETAEQAANVFLVNEIGELAKISLLKDVKIIPKLEMNLENLKSSIEQLKNKLNSFGWH
jgi:hypothetical protein